MSLVRGLSARPVLLGALLAAALVLPIAAFAAYTRATIGARVDEQTAQDREGVARLAASLMSRKIDNATLVLARFVDRADVSVALAAGDATAISALLTDITGVRQGVFSSTGLVDAGGATLAHAPTADVDVTLDRRIAAQGIGKPGTNGVFLPRVSEKWSDLVWGAYGAVTIPVPWGPRTAALYGLLEVRSFGPLDSVTLPPGRSIIVLTDDAVILSVTGAMYDGSDPVLFPQSRRGDPIPGFAEAIRDGLGSEPVDLQGHAHLATHVPIFDGAWVIYVLDDLVATERAASGLTGPVTLGAGIAAAVAIGLAALVGLLLSRIRDQQRQLSSLAVSDERLRIARDLHDLLGHGLSLIAIKSELAARLLPRDGGAAAREVADIQDIARTALRDVREAVVGYREPRLEGELVEARRTLEAAGIGCDVEGEVTELPSAIDALFAWAVRESVTNTVRHSGAARCRIRLTHDEHEVSVEITDDGMGSLAPTLGSGLLGLIERAKARGGVATAAPLAAHGFRVRVAVPLEPV